MFIPHNPLLIESSDKDWTDPAGQNCPRYVLMVQREQNGYHLMAAIDRATQEIREQSIMISEEMTVEKLTKRVQRRFDRLASGLGDQGIPSRLVK